MGTAAVEPTQEPWQVLEGGLEVGRFTLQLETPAGDSTLTILRADPAQWDLVFAGSSQKGGGKGATARQWAKRKRLVVATNAGMFAKDFRTHIGYLSYRGHVNSSRLNHYQSLAAFDLKEGRDLPPFRIFDLDEAGVTLESILADYLSVVQNLRLIKHPGTNRWSKQEKRWSEAALGQDRQGRMLFVFCRSPYTMRDLNLALLDLNIGLVAAQHLEGGPEAQLYFRAGGQELELYGSYETSFYERDDNPEPWPVPNILGLRPRPAISNQDAPAITTGKGGSVQ